MSWLPIETAPRDPPQRILVASRSEFRGWTVNEAWWATPFNGATNYQCHWCFDGNRAMLDRSIHGVGATHWQPLPAPPEDET